MDRIAHHMDKTMTKYNDYPLADLKAGADEIIKESAGKKRVYFKWTCGACGERVTAMTPNVIYTSAEHQDCEVTPGFVTDTRKTGGNYMVIEVGSPEGFQALRNMGLDDTPNPGLSVTMTSMGAVDITGQREAIEKL